MRSKVIITAGLSSISLCLTLLLSGPVQAQSSTVSFLAAPNEVRAGQPATIRLSITPVNSSPVTLSTGDTFGFFFEPSIGSLTGTVGGVAVDSTSLAASDFSASINGGLNELVITYHGLSKAFPFGSIVSVEVGFQAASQTGAGRISFSSRFVNSINGNLPFTVISLVDFGGAVSHDGTLTGDGTTVPLGIAAGGVNTTQLADQAVTTPKLADQAVTSTKIAPGAVGGGQIADGAVSTTKLADKAVTGPKIADGAVVRSLNNLTDAVTLAAGSNVTIGFSGNTLTIGSTGSGSQTKVVSTATNGATDFGLQFDTSKSSKIRFSVKANGTGTMHFVLQSGIGTENLLTPDGFPLDDFTVAAGASATKTYDVVGVFLRLEIVVSDLNDRAEIVIFGN